jgi:hypothetical protein
MWHNTFHRDFGRMPIGGGVGGMRKLVGDVVGDSYEEA